MSHFIFEHEKAQSLKAYFVQLMLEKGFLASNAFYAMHAHSGEHVRGYLQAADAAFAEIACCIDQKDVGEKLAGRPACAGFKRIT